MERMKQSLSILLTPIFYLYFGLTLVVFHPIQVLTRLSIGAKMHDRVVAALNFFLMRCINILGASYRFIGFQKLPTNKPIIFVSNHQSMWDIPPLIWKFRKHRPKFVAKKELARFIPSISYNLRVGGSVAIDRKNPESAVAKISAFAKNIGKNKFSICIFPEGKRNTDGIIQQFKISGLEAILKEIPDALVVPVVIRNTNKIDIKGKFWKRIGVKVSFSQLKPRKVSLQNISEEIEAIRQEMISVAAQAA